MPSLVRALIALNLQNDFCGFGTVAVPGGAEAARNISHYIRNTIGRYELILAANDNHIDPNGHFDESPDFISTWPPHCIKGTQGAQLHANLESSLLDHTVFKGEYNDGDSAFEGRLSTGESLIDLLERREIEAIDICGIPTENSVTSTALDAIEKGFPTTVLIDLVAGFNENESLEALETLELRGVNLIQAFLDD